MSNKAIKNEVAHENYLDRWNVIVGVWSHKQIW